MQRRMPAHSYTGGDLEIVGASDDMKAAVQAYADAGFEHMVLMVNTPYDLGSSSASRTR